MQRSIVNRRIRNFGDGKPAARHILTFVVILFIYGIGSQMGQIPIMIVKPNINAEIYAGPVYLKKDRNN